MDPFKPLMAALAMPWESGWGREVCSKDSLPSDPARLEAIALGINESRQAVGDANAMVRATKRVAEAARSSDECPEPVLNLKTREEEDQNERRQLLSELEDWLLSDGSWSKLGSILLETRDGAERSSDHARCVC